METSNIELGNLMLKLHELPDGDKRRALVLPLHARHLNQRSPFSALKPQSTPRVVKYFQPKSVHLNINGTHGRVHYDNSVQLCLHVSLLSVQPGLGCGASRLACPSRRHFLSGHKKPSPKLSRPIEIN